MTEQGNQPGESQGGAVDHRASESAIRSFLRRVRRRLVADRLINYLCTDLLLALSVVTAVILLDRLLFPGIASWEVAGLILGVAVVATLTRTLVRGRFSLFQAAVEADRRLGLNERVSSACYTHHFESDGAPRSAGEPTTALEREWADLVLEDAGHSLQGVSIPQSFPLRPGRRARWLALPLVLSVALALWVPSYDPLGLRASEEPEDALVKKAMEAEKKKLDKELEELLKKAEKEESEEAKKLLAMLAQQAAKKEPAEKPPEDPKKAEGNKSKQDDPQKNALLELARREDVLKKGVNNKKFTALRKALKELSGLQVKSSQQTRALQAALKDGDFAKAKKELDALKKQLAQLSSKKPSELTSEEKELLKKLQEELASLSRNAGALGQLAPNLSSLGSMSAADLQQMLQNMDQFAMDLDSLAKMSNDLDFLNQALEMIQLSKQDLAQLAQHKCPNCGKKLGDGKGGT